MTNFIDTVRDAYPIDRALKYATGTDVIGSGSARMACCPFHEDRNPSLSVNMDKGVYKCHSAGCGAQGDVFTLLQSAFSMTFMESVTYAAQACGIPLPDDFSGATVKQPRRRKFISAPSDDLGSVPAGLQDPALIALGGDIPLPSAGKSVEAYRLDRPAAQAVRKYFPQMVHVYRDIEGHPLLLVLRCFMKQKDHPDGGKKYFIPLHAKTLSEKTSARIKGQDDPFLSWVVGSVPETCYRPIYGIHDLHGLDSPRSLLLVEGEKTADATNRMLMQCDDRPLVISPMGGGESVLRMHWAPMMEMIRKGLIQELVIWPDADTPLTRPDGSIVDRQRKFSAKIMIGLLSALRNAGIDENQISIRIVTPPSGKESGWDLADAEQDGWGGKDVLNWISGNSFSPDDPDKRIVDDVKKSLESSAPTPEDRSDALSEESEFPMPDALQQFDMMMAGIDEDVDPLPPENILGLPSEAIEDCEEIPGPGEDGDEEDPFQGHDPDSKVLCILDNPYFRPLGHNNGADYFISLDSGYIYALTAHNLKAVFLLKLARKDWWKKHFPKATNKKDETPIDWEGAADALVAASYSQGVWDPSLERGQGATMDEGRVVFNTGNTLWIEGVGQVPIKKFRGKNCYTVGIATSMPAFHNPFKANDPSVLKFLEIISSLNWKKETRELSIMGLFGWVCTSPITGIMSWRPHLWLSGPRSAGKSWVLRNLIAAALGDYAYYIKSNSTEPGIRRGLHAKSLPLIFDEAEGETRGDRERIDAIIKMARHAASDDNSVVMQASTNGSSESARYRIRSSFLFSSITTQLDASADKTRFANAYLDEGRGLVDFSKHVQDPAMELLTPEFSQRFIARMIMRAPDMQVTHKLMIQALSMYNLERRIVDVYSAFASGAWLMLRDGVPEDKIDAYEFVGEVFSIGDQIKRFNQDVSEEKDHTRLFRFIQAHGLRVETSNMGQRSISIGQLISAASGWADQDDAVISTRDAIASLKEIGIRPVHADLETRGENDFELIKEGHQANAVVIHRNSTPINAILKETPYVRNYSQVMLQSSDVFTGRPVRFSETLGVSRGIVVPLSVFSLGEGDEG